jgi:hypothetical protein
MGFIILKPKHNCELPNVQDYEYGTYWQCDDCLQIYVVRNLSVKPNAPDIYKTWMKSNLSVSQILNENITQSSMVPGKRPVATPLETRIG